MPDNMNFAGKDALLAALFLLAIGIIGGLVFGGALFNALAVGLMLVAYVFIPPLALLALAAPFYIVYKLFKLVAILRSRPWSGF